MAKDWCSSCRNISKDYDDIVCVMCVWQEEDNDNLPPTNYIFKPQTNADKVRSMTDEELAEAMHSKIAMDCLDCPVLKADCPAWESKSVECKDAMLNWLKQESK